MIITKEDLINIAKESAIDSLQHFLELIDIPKSILNRINNINIELNKEMSESKEAEYDLKDNIIYINEILCEKVVNKMNQNSNLYLLGLKLMSKIIIHEMLHANRTKEISYTNENEEIIERILPCDIKRTNENKLIQSSEEHEKAKKTDFELMFYQKSFEEIITEAIAIIISETNDRNYVDLTEIVKNEIPYNKEPEIAGLKIIEYSGIDSISWFLTSAYDEKYYDYFDEIFGEKYLDLLKNIDEIYKKRIIYGKSAIYELKQVEKTIEEKSITKKGKQK